MGLQFCSIEDVKAYANVSEGYAVTDGTIQRFIEQATAKICTFTRRRWTYGKYTDFVDLAGNSWNATRERRYQEIYVSERPLRTDPAPVIKYTTTGDVQNMKVLSRDLYQVNEHKGSITLLLAHSPQMPRALRIEFWAGYETNPDNSEHVMVSDDLREACAMQAAFLYTRGQNETLGLKKHQDKSGIKEYHILGSGFIREVQGLITPHVRSLTGG